MKEPAAWTALRGVLALPWDLEWWLATALLEPVTGIALELANNLGIRVTSRDMPGPGWVNGVACLTNWTFVCQLTQVSLRHFELQHDQLLQWLDLGCTVLAGCRA